MKTLDDIKKIAEETKNEGFDYLDFLNQTSDSIKKIDLDNKKKKIYFNEIPTIEAFYYLEAYLIRTLIATSILPNSECYFKPNKFTTMLKKIDEYYCDRIIILFSKTILYMVNQYIFSNNYMTIEQLEEEFDNEEDYDQEESEKSAQCMLEYIYDTERFLKLYHVILSDNLSLIDEKQRNIDVRKINKNIIKFLESNFIKDICNNTIFSDLFPEMSNIDKVYYERLIDLVSCILSERKLDTTEKIILEDECGYKQTVSSNKYNEIMKGFFN